MKKLVFAVVAALTVTVTASAADNTQKPRRKLNIAKVREGQMKRFGGMIQDTRGQKGKVVVVNAQTAAEESWISSVLKGVAGQMKVTSSIEKGSFDLMKPTCAGEATLFVVDNPMLPMSLLAPESKWAMVNVAPLKTDKAKFFEMRVRKEVSRALAYLLGAGNSQYELSLMGCVTNAEGLDRFVDDKLPIDVLSRLPKYAEGYGITPFKMAKYSDAVSEGWAPQPTNEYQKAIWDQVHTLPTDPIKIKYDPKRDK